MTKREPVTRGALGADAYDAATAHLVLGLPAMPEYPYPVYAAHVAAALMRAARDAPAAVAAPEPTR